MLKIRILRLGIRGLVLLSLLLGAPAPSDLWGGDVRESEINHLLEFIRSSECTFIRNGQVHDGREAGQHIKRKYGHLAGRIRTAEDFIKYAATRSSVSGRLYLVRCQGREIPTHEWLRSELAAHRRAIAGQRAGPAK